MNIEPNGHNQQEDDLNELRRQHHQDNGHIPEGLELLSKSEINQLVRSKADFRFIMTTRGGYHLPPVGKLNWRYIRQILNGSKKLMKIQQLRLVDPPPRIRELTVRAIWPQVCNDQNLLSYLPDLRPGQLPERRYFFQLLSSLYPEQYRILVDQTLQRRKERERVERTYRVDSEIHQILNSNRESLGLRERGRPSTYLFAERRDRGW